MLELDLILCTCTGSLCTKLS